MLYVVRKKKSLAYYMHRNHRILDLRAFRRLVERGLIPPEEFITIETGKQEVVTRHFKNSVNVRAFYEGKTQYKVRCVVAFI